jgi:anti-sigma regulatory factor (Ser/Thr protein kinase)
VKPSARSRSILVARDLPSEPVEVDAFCCEVRRILTESGLSADAFPVEMLLRESLNNALIHGNCRDCEKRIRAEVRIGRKWIALKVADEGTGFSPRKAMNALPAPEKTSGRGLAIYFLYANRVSFSSKGNQVSFWREITGE